MKKFDYSYIAVFTAGAIGLSAMASNVNVLDTVYVTDEASVVDEVKDGSTDEVTLEDIEQSEPSSLDDVLKRSTGATTKGGPRSIGETPQIRGLEAGKIFVYIDGVKQSSYFSNHNYSFLAVDPDNIKKVNIYKSNSAISEGMSLGGGISIATKDAEDYLTPSQKSGSLVKYKFQESNRERSTAVKSYAKFKDGSYVIGFNEKDGKDIVLGDGSTLLNSSYKSINLSGKLNYRPRAYENIKFSVESFKLNDNSPLNATLNPPNSEVTLHGETEVRRETISTQYTFLPKSKRFININSNFYNTKQTTKQTRLSDGRIEKRIAESSGGKINNRFDISKKAFVDTGIEIIQTRHKGTRNNDVVGDFPSGRTQDQVFYVDSVIKPVSWFSISPGAHFTRYNLEVAGDRDAPTSDTNTSLKLSNKISKNGFGLGVNYSEGFNTPKMQEIYAKGIHTKGDEFYLKDNHFIPNLELIPETSKMLEVEISAEKSLFGGDDLFTFKASHYWTRASNFITQERKEKLVFEPGGNGTTQFVNLDKVSLKGGEVEAGFLLNQFEGKLNFSRSIGIEKDTGKYLESMPADTYTLELKYYLDRHGMSFGYQGIKTMATNKVNYGTMEKIRYTPGYSVHNIFATKEFSRGLLKDFKFVTRIENLTGRVYRRHGSFLTETGQDFKLSMQYKIKHF